MTTVLGRITDLPSAADQRFADFHQANPHIYAELVRLAQQARAAGRKKLGIRMLWERMRWTFIVETVRPDGDPKLNNDYTSRYARLIMQQVPALDGMFDLRELRS